MKQYFVEQISKSGNVLDVRIFDTKEEAQKELDFNRKFYPQLKWRMREEECKVLFERK